MNSKKRVTRKELLKKQDEFITISRRVVQYVQSDTRMVYSVAIALACVLALGGVIYVYFRQQHNEAVAWEREALEVYYQQIPPENKSASDARYKAAVDKLNRLIEEHGGSSQAQRAELYLADSYYQLKKYAEAEQAYQEYLDKYNPKDVFRYLALSSQGQIAEAQGRYSQAVDYYQQAAQGASVLQQAQAKLDIGRCYEKLAKPGQAKQAYQEAVKMLPDKPMYRSLADQLKASLNSLEPVASQ